jgi:hypothetical protein
MLIVEAKKIYQKNLHLKKTSYTFEEKKEQP